MPLSLRLTQDVEQRLSHLANRTGRSKTFYVLEAIREHIAALEELYLAEQEALDVRSGKSKTRPLADVEADLVALDAGRDGKPRSKTRPSTGVAIDLIAALVEPARKQQGPKSSRPTAASTKAKSSRAHR